MRVSVWVRQNEDTEKRKESVADIDEAPRSRLNRLYLYIYIHLLSYKYQNICRARRTKTQKSNMFLSNSITWKKSYFATRSQHIETGKATRPQEQHVSETKKEKKNIVLVSPKAIETKNTRKKRREEHLRWTNVSDLIRHSHSTARSTTNQQHTATLAVAKRHKTLLYTIIFVPNKYSIFVLFRTSVFYSAAFHIE